MYDNYPPGAANDPHAPYNQPEPDDVDFSVEIEIERDEGPNKTEELTVTVSMYEDEDYSYLEILSLLRDELDSMLGEDVDYDILDYHEL